MQNTAGASVVSLLLSVFYCMIIAYVIAFSLQDDEYQGSLPYIAIFSVLGAAITLITSIRQKSTDQFYYKRRYFENFSRLFIAMGLISTISATIYFQVSFKAIPESLITIIVGSLVSLVIVAGYAYLQGDEINKSWHDQFKEERLDNIEKFADKIDSRLKSVEGISDIRSKEVIDEKIKEVVEDIVTSEATRKAVSTIKGAMKQQKELMDEHQYASTFNAKTINRLTEEVKNLGKRANFNLWLGMIFAISGAIVLGELALSSKSPSALALPAESGETISAPAGDSETTADTAWLLSEYLPRLSLAIIIEVFAYFFLNLYRASMVEIKYYQNEVTNVEMMLSAMNLAVLRSREAKIDSLIDRLAETERNFVLKKGESTVEVEKARLDVEQQKSMLQGLLSVFNKQAK